MPCLYITTNVNLDAVDADPIYAETTQALSSIIGKPQHLVMVVMKGSTEIWFNENREAAAYAEVVSMGGINRQVKRKLIGAIGKILETHLSIPTTRFFLKVYDTTAIPSKL
ncbi:macrophage migration inhibitory factor homolog [Carica papaya]|uniref:macrophage migration inhibitory factor homolog n=1 Tax=Carica papaya TaxID=3649 RepID=UPI000B8D160F|nr:macrophage migration inhibitory factor homolog [Carica papaya]